ncbi:MAG: hypothetical protein KHZ99_14110 [Clostridium sp.]|uniref:hypothetical protein n=1 Tax=Clostridium sp. TaxID=1506 RepID=UPI0025C3688F|nr:hypothetical protein [Clostridium sp.]MBS4958166.1 hypothetical protein [Clostridium sp.]
MSLKLKEGIDKEKLKKYGFKTGKEWAEQGERCLKGEGYKYQHDWYHKFLMDEEDSNKIMYADEEYDQPIVHISIRIGENFNNDLYIDCTPSGTYHIGGSELDIVTETVFDLVNDGLLER